MMLCVVVFYCLCGVYSNLVGWLVGLGWVGSTTGGGFAFGQLLGNL